jgi:hypothetical protein
MSSPDGLCEVLFYVPKDSSRAQLLEGRVNLLRMIQEIPLLMKKSQLLRMALLRSIA